MRPIWSYRWQAPKLGTRQQQRMVLMISGMVDTKGKPFLRLEVEAALGRVSWLRRTVVWTAVACCHVHISLAQAKQLHSALSQWLGIPVPGSRLPSPRDEGGAPPGG